MTHGLVLQVVVPLAAAPLCLLLRSGRIAAWLAVAVALYTLGNSVALLGQVRAEGPLQYVLGGMEVPYGIEYRLDLLNAFVLVVVSAVTAVTTWWAAVSSPHELGGARRDLFFTTWLLCVTGMMGIVVTADAFNVFVFLEIASLSGYVLVAQGRHRRALVASFRYLLTGTVGATFILIGVGFLYMMTGTLNLGDLAERLPPVSDARAVQAGWAFISVGLCLKAAVFPVHLWLPGAYASAPSAVTALLAGTSTKVAVYLWFRFFFATFSPAVPFEEMPIDDVLLVLGLSGALVASLVAVFQEEPKRLLAWSSIAQVGYMVVGMSLATEAGLEATVTHLMNHAVMKTAAFLALGAVVLRLGAQARALTFDDLAGLSRRMPWTAAALLIAGLGLIGMPLTAGFVSKWLLVEALLEFDLWTPAVVVLMSSLLAAVYVWRLVEPMYFRPPPETPAAPVGRGTWVALAVPTWLLCLATVVLGVTTVFSVDIAREAVTALLGGGS